MALFLDICTWPQSQDSLGIRIRAGEKNASIIVCVHNIYYLSPRELMSFLAAVLARWLAVLTAAGR